MSRTDNTRPWRIRAADRTAPNPFAYYWHSPYDHRTHDGLCGNACGYTLPHWYLTAPPHWFIHHVWWGPERTRERMHLGAMAKEYNVNYYLEDEDFPNYHHRHMGHWLYW